MKKIIALSFTLILITSISGCASKKSDALTFATEATYPPFVSMNSDGKMVGFGPDLVHDVCHIMHKSCQLVSAPWNSLIPSLLLGKFDVLFGGMAITKVREQVVDFSIPYYQNAVVYVVNKKHPLNLSSEKMTGKTIGVQGGTTFETYIKQEYGKAVNLKLYQSNMTALLDLKAGRVDAVFIDEPVATQWLKNPKNHAFMTEGKIMNVNLFGPGNAFAINKSNKALTKQINTALMQLKANGTLLKLEKKWFKAN